MANRLRSDAAYRRAIAERKNKLYASVDQFSHNNDILIELSTLDEVVAEISLKEVIAKRKSLRGVNARLKEAIRPKKKVSRKRK